MDDDSEIRSLVKKYLFENKFLVSLQPDSAEDAVREKLKSSNLI